MAKNGFSSYLREMALHFGSCLGNACFLVDSKRSCSGYPCFGQPVVEYTNTNKSRSYNRQLRSYGAW